MLDRLQNKDTHAVLSEPVNLTEVRCFDSLQVSFVVFYLDFYVSEEVYFYAAHVLCVLESPLFFRFLIINVELVCSS
ncbi:hypothetical protein HanPI659440_Chr09g0333661 [Helianthus annuus]|nr:hypothetical protein HanPI659440_Chr09g0333661 [Helianthus annuus]